MMFAPAHQPLPARLTALHVGAVAFLLALGAWLGWDLGRERQDVLAQSSRLAMQKSQFLARAFGDTFLATDFVLRDVLWHVRHDVPPRSSALGRTADRGAAESLLRAKVTSIPALTDLVVFDENCIFTALAVGHFHGRHSTQDFCADRLVGEGEQLHIQYLPTEKSASRRPVMVMSRTVGDVQGRLQGGVLAVLDLGDAQRWLSRFEADAQDVLALLDGHGTLLARVPADPDALGLHFDPVPGQPRFGEVWDVVAFEGMSPLDGRRRVYGMSRLESFPVVALVGFDQTAVLRSWRHRAWLLSVGYGGLLLLALYLLRTQRQMLLQRAELQRLAATDALTGIANRRQLIATGRREHARARRSGRPLAVLLLDLDHFKAINDRWGHASGDRVIQNLAYALELQARKQDMAARLGGEEFALLLPDTDVPGALVVAERLRTTAQNSEDVHSDDGDRIGYTVSIGVAVLHPGDEAFEALLRRADKALYRAKDLGRNRVELALIGAS